MRRHVSTARVDRTRPTTRVALLALVLALPIAACHSQSAPAKDAETGGTLVSGNPEAEFDGAEQELIALVIGDGEETHIAKPPGPRVDPVPEPFPGPGPVPGIPKPGIQATSKKDRCTRACKALASMQRAADQLCELDGESSDRCRSVRARVRSARHLVQSTCPTCTA
jgi:hypothetical protein